MQSVLTSGAGQEVLDPETQSSNILEAIRPFIADDGLMGTYLVLRIAGLDKTSALKNVGRKYRTWQNWRTIDPDFRRLDDMVPQLTNVYANQARIIRASLLDASIVETGIKVFRDILNGTQIADGAWSYAAKMAAMRVPVMFVGGPGESSWEKLSKAIGPLVQQREVTVREEVGGIKTVTAKEILVESTMSRQAAEIVKAILEGNGIGTDSD